MHFGSPFVEPCLVPGVERFVADGLPRFIEYDGLSGDVAGLAAKVPGDGSRGDRHVWQFVFAVKRAFPRIVARSLENI